MQHTEIVFSFLVVVAFQSVEIRQRFKTFSIIWTASSEFGTYRLCEQRRFRRACVSAQSRQNLRCSLIQALNQEELSDRKPDPWPLWMAGQTQLKLVMTECSKTQIRLTGPILVYSRQCVIAVDSKSTLLVVWHQQIVIRKMHVTWMSRFVGLVIGLIRNSDFRRKHDATLHLLADSPVLLCIDDCRRCWNSSNRNLQQ